MIIHVEGFVRDSFSLGVTYDSGLYEDIQEQGYVPHCTLGGGDYISFEVDNTTGQIIGWQPIDVEYLIQDNS